MKMAYGLCTIFLVFSWASIASHASDPSPLQDFCVAVADADAAGITFPTKANYYNH